MCAAAATVGAMPAGSVTGASSTSHTPSGKRSRRAAAGGGEREPGFAAAAGPGQGQQPVRLEALDRARELTLPSDERRRLRRKVVGSRVKTTQRGEGPRQPVDLQLVDALRPHQVFESVLAEV